MNIGIYIYDEVEVLDFAGPFEVFSVAARFLPPGHLDVSLIGESGDVVSGRNGFRVMPDHTITDHPVLDVLIVPGGVHTMEMTKTTVIDWIRAQAPGTRMTASVCTGAFLLAEAGLLEGIAVTTHWEDIADLRASYPKLDVRENARWLKHERVATSAGISAGIDMSLALVADLYDETLAATTARQMEYDTR